MKKLKRSLIILMTVVLIIVAAAFFGGCGDTSQGIIRGLEGGEFVVHFDEGIFFQDGTTRLISSRTELVEFLAEQDVGTTNGDLFPKYDDYFFTTHQLIFVSFGGRPRQFTDYEVRRIEYQNNALTIEFVTTRRIGTVPDVAEYRAAIIEITRISDNLNVVFSHRDR